MAQEIILRRMEPRDAPAIAALDRESPDTGAVAFSTKYLVDPFAALSALHPGSVGVVAEASDQPGIVGMGAMSLGRCRYEGALRGYAYLFAITVHPAHRRRGIASSIYSWLIAGARDRLGDDTVVIAGIQEGNEGSLRAARRWSTRIERRTLTAMTNMRSRAPRSVGDIEVRPAGASDWDEIACGQDAFYHGYNLYPPRSAAEMKELHDAEPFGARLRHYLVAVDHRRSIVAGLSVTDEGAIEPMEITRIPPPLRIANSLFRVLPTGGVMRRLPVRDFWYAPEREDDGVSLWETARWLMREHGHVMMAFVDARGPLARVIPRMPFVPRRGGYLALCAPVPPSAGRLFYHHS